MDVKLSFLQEYENAWFFKPEVVKHQGLILLVGSFDENEFGGVFDTVSVYIYFLFPYFSSSGSETKYLFLQNFLYSVKVNNSMRYMILAIQYESMTEQVPDELLNAAGKWIGSVYVKRVLTLTFEILLTLIIQIKRNN